MVPNGSRPKGLVVAVKFHFPYKDETYHLESLRPPSDASEYSPKIAMWMALCAATAYEECSLAKTRLRRAGFMGPVAFAKKGTEAVAAYHPNDRDPFTVLAFRGTKQGTDWVTNGRFLKVSLESCEGCRAHGGFWRALDAVWDDSNGRPGVKSTVLTYQREHGPHPIYVTGHSLGGALGILAAHRLTDEASASPAAVYTIGSPRVGNWRLADDGEVPIHRVVNQFDWVPRLPPAVLLYRHTGTEHWLGSDESKDRILTPDASRAKKIEWASAVYDVWFKTMLALAFISILGSVAVWTVVSKGLEVDLGLWPTLVAMLGSWVALFVAGRAITRLLPGRLSRMFRLNLIGDHFSPEYLDLLDKRAGPS